MLLFNFSFKGKLNLYLNILEIVSTSKNGLHKKPIQNFPMVKTTETTPVISAIKSGNF